MAVRAGTGSHTDDGESEEDSAGDSDADLAQEHVQSQNEDDEGIEAGVGVERKPTGSEDAVERKARKKANKKRKALQAERERTAGKRGVCYLSRVPPHMKPLKLRHILSEYGEVHRIYLVPEDPAVRMRRKRAGGNSGKNFTEGWVEFAKKSVAKRVASMLNGEPMGGKRRSAYFYDLWNIKYLRKFKWDNLTEEIAYKNAVHDQKLDAELSAAKKERDFYLSRVDQSRAIKSMEERKRKREEEAKPGTDTGSKPALLKSEKIVRHFQQKKSVTGDVVNKSSRLSADVLAAVFGSKPSKLGV